MANLTLRDASILGLVARANNESKSEARKLLIGLELEVKQAGLLIIGDVSEKEVSERSKQLAKTAMDWVKARKD